MSLVTIATLVALAVGGFFWSLSRGPVSLAFMRNTVEAQINKNLPGMTVKLDDVVIEREGGSLIPGIRLLNLELQDKAGNTVARAPHAAFNVDQAALLRGDVVPRDLDLIGPRIMIKRSLTGGFVMGFGTPAAEPAEHAKDANGKSDQAASAEPIEVKTPGADIIDLLSGPQPGGEAASGAMSNVDFIKISKASLTLFDESNNAYWNAPNADLVFKRMPYGFAVVANASIQSEGQPIRTEIAANYRREQKAFSVSARIFDFVPSAASRKVFALSQLAKVNVPLSGHAELDMTIDGKITKGSAEFSMAAGEVGFPGYISEPIIISEGAVRFDYDPATGGAILTDSVIATDGGRSSLTGRIDPVRNDAGILQAFKIVLEARAAGNGEGEPPAVVDRIDFRGTASIVTPRLDVDDLLVMQGEAGLRLRGVFTGGEKSPGISLAGRIRNMPAPLLKSLWPPIVAPNTRKWVYQNIEAGRIVDGEMTIRLAPNQLAESKDTKELPEDSVKLEFALADVRTKYFRGLPEISSASGRASVLSNTFSLTLDQGSIDVPSGKKIALTGGTMVITDLLKPVSPAEFNIAANAAVPTVFEYMSLPDLNLLKVSGLDIGKVSGSAEMAIKLSIPFMKDLPRDLVKVSAKATVTDASLQDAINDIDITDGKLAIEVAGGAITGEGPVKLDGIPAKLTWSRTEGPQAKQSATIETELDDKERNKIGAKIGSFLTGPVNVKVTIPDLEQSSTVKVDADLSKAALAIDAINWTRGPAKGTKASFTYKKDEDGGVIEDLVISGGELSLKGDIALTKDGGFRTAKLPVVNLDDENKFGIELKRSGGGVTASIDGKSFDARPLIKLMFGKSGGGDGGGGGDNPVTYLINANVDRVYAHRGEVITGLTGNLTVRGGSVLSANIQGTFLSGQPITMRIEQGNGGRELRITGRDGGSALRAANLYSKIAGGQLDFYALMGPPSQSGGVRRGQLNLRNFEVRNEAALAELDRRGRPKAAGPRSDSIAFKRLKLPFTTDARFIRIGEAEVSGNEICATVDKGLIRKSDSAVDIDGTIIPACGLNNIPGKIPVVGLLFGEGLFALEYALYGTISNPKFQFNPVSAIAPGILRKFFEYGDATSPPKSPKAESN